MKKKLETLVDKHCKIVRDIQDELEKLDRWGSDCLREERCLEEGYHEVITLTNDENIKYCCVCGGVV